MHFRCWTLIRKWLMKHLYVFQIILIIVLLLLEACSGVLGWIWRKTEKKNKCFKCKHIRRWPKAWTELKNVTEENKNSEWAWVWRWHFELHAGWLCEAQPEAERLAGWSEWKTVTREGGEGERETKLWGGGHNKKSTVTQSDGPTWPWIF